MLPDLRADRTATIAQTVLLVAIAAPLVWVIGYSFAYSFGAIGYLSDGLTLAHWSSAVTWGGLSGSLAYSLTVALLVTLISTILALTVVLTWPESRRSRWLLALLCLPLATPGAALAVMTYQLLNPGGYVARIAFHLGVVQSPSDVPPLVNDRLSFGLMVAQIAAAGPLLTLFLFNAWSAAQVDRYCRLAESLGASRRQARLRIALPMLLQRGRALIVLTFLWTFGSYEMPLLLGRQSPQMISVVTQRRFGQFHLRERPEAFVFASLYFLLASAGLLLFFTWRLRRDASRPASTSSRSERGDER